MSTKKTRQAVWGVIPAGGSSQRFRDSREFDEWDCPEDGDKLLSVLPDVGLTVLSKSIHALLTYPTCEGIVVAVADHNLLLYQQTVARELGYEFCEYIDWVVGGASRRQSVFNALKKLNAPSHRASQTDLVCIHDGARPWATHELMHKLIGLFNQDSILGSIPALPITDTIKSVNEDGQITSTPDRSKLVAVQTPQVFRLHDILTAHESVDPTLTATDDAQLVERAIQLGQLFGQVLTVEGELSNRKITVADDLNKQAVLF